MNLRSQHFLLFLFPSYCAIATLPSTTCQLSGFTIIIFWWLTSHPTHKKLLHKYHGVNEPYGTSTLMAIQCRPIMNYYVVFSTRIDTGRPLSRRQYVCMYVCIYPPGGGPGYISVCSTRTPWRHSWRPVAIGDVSGAPGDGTCCRGGRVRRADRLLAPLSAGVARLFAMLAR